MIGYRAIGPPSPVESAAHWAAQTFRQRTEEIAAGRGRIDDANPGSRVPWSEVRERFGLTFADREAFTAALGVWLTRWKLRSVVSGKVSSTEWVKRRNEQKRRADLRRYGL